jgi:hypothetical protein
MALNTYLEVKISDHYDENAALKQIESCNEDKSSGKEKYQTKKYFYFYFCFSILISISHYYVNHLVRRN